MIQYVLFSKYGPLPDSESLKYAIELHFGKCSLNHKSDQKSEYPAFSCFDFLFCLLQEPQP